MKEEYFDNLWMNKNANYHLLVLLYRGKRAELCMYENLRTVFREWCGKETGLSEKEMRELACDYIVKRTGAEFALLFTKENGETRKDFVERCWKNVRKYGDFADVPGKVQVKMCVYCHGRYKETNKIRAVKNEDN